MFYSHQLLARKAPLGQIWMAATMHSKINRRKLVQIDLIRICEEILNPSVPMALRLSGILMGGVVIVYERKVKLLYDDVNRLLVELNTAWKVKPIVDPTILPKGKNQAKFEAVTLPEKQDADIGDIEQSIDSSSRFTSSATFQQTAYLAMRLDTIDELGESLREKEPNEQHHQADPANITLPPDPFWPPAPGLFNHFERFDIDGDEETFNNFPSQGQTDMPPPSVHSPPPEMEIPKDDNLNNAFMADDTHVQHPEEQADLSSPKLREARQRNIPMQRPARKKARQAPFIMDNEQIMIPSSMYQTWLHDTTDTWLKRPNITEQAKGKSAVKLAKLLDLPPVALSCGLVGKCNEVNYPKQLLDLWFTSMQPVQDSPSGKTTSPNPPEPSSSSPPLAQEYHHDPLENPMGDFGTGVPTVRFPSGERLVPDPAEDTIYASRIFHEGLATDNPNPNPTTTNSGTPHADPSPDPGVDYVSNYSNSISGRLSKKRLSSANHNSTGLESVDEENPWVHAAAVDTLPVLKEQPQQRSKMPRYSRNSATPDHEFLVETGPTQTQQAAVMNEEAERKASSIATQFKSYFEAPGAPEKESLNQLALGLNRRGAAQLFYQTCVLATRDILKVEQNSAYGDIIISRGPKM